MIDLYIFSGIVFAVSIFYTIWLVRPIKPITHHQARDIIEDLKAEIGIVEYAPMTFSKKKPYEHSPAKNYITHCSECGKLCTKNNFWKLALKNKEPLCTDCEDEKYKRMSKAPVPHQSTCNIEQKQAKHEKVK